jgi:hypothetical protein
MSRKMVLIFVTMIILLSSFMVLAPTPPPPPDITPTPPPPPPATCTPGFWKQPQHFQYWEGYDPSDDYNGYMTLLQALQGGYATRESRFIVAGWLNAANPDAPCD